MPRVRKPSVRSLGASLMIVFSALRARGAPSPPTASDPVLVGAGDIAACDNDGDERTAKILDKIEGTVFTLGDNVYSSGTAQQFDQCYEPSWGRHKARTRPAPGNHDYRTTGAAAYFAYSGHPPGIRRRATTATTSAPGTSSSSTAIAARSAGARRLGPGEVDPRRSRRALDALAVAMWHHPRFSSGTGHGNDPEMRPIWRALNRQASSSRGRPRAQLRAFRPAGRRRKADPEHGIREFVAGTGGKSFDPLGTSCPTARSATIRPTGS